jgi:two-component system LytT family response regulator
VPLIRAVIVEDEKVARSRLSRFLKAHNDVELAGEAATGLEAIRLIERTSPDLVVLDVQLPDITGFEVLEHLTERPHVIFSTAYDKYAIGAFEVEAVDFLLKPYLQERIDKALERVRGRIAAAHPPTQLADLLKMVQGQRPAHSSRIALRDNEHIVLAALSDIFYFIAEGETVYARLADRRLLVKRTLRELESRVESERFFRANRAVLVNLDRVSEIHPWFSGRFVVRFNKLDRNEQIEVSQRQAKKLRELLNY